MSIGWTTLFCHVSLVARRIVLALSTTWFIANSVIAQTPAMPLGMRRLPTIHQTESDRPGPLNGNLEVVPATFSNEQIDWQLSSEPGLRPVADWLEHVRVGYQGGFLIASQAETDMAAPDFPFRLRLNGWGQLRHTVLNSDGPNRDLNQIQLKRARLVLSGNAWTPEFSYFTVLDGRSSSGDDLRLLDYYLTFDFGRYLWQCEPGYIGLKAGKYKMPFHLARYLSSRSLEFTDRSMASAYFDVNRSLGWGLYGRVLNDYVPYEWEVALFNGLVSGGAETGSSGTLDNNNAYSARIISNPIGEWGDSGLADFSCHSSLAIRFGGAFAFSTIDRFGTTEFGRIRVVDSGATLAATLPPATNSYSVSLFSVDASFKYRGWSGTFEYYFRNIENIQGAAVPDLYDHGYWLQAGRFIIPEKLQLVARWSRVVGDSGTLGAATQSSDEVAAGLVWYIRGQSVKWTVDATHLNGAPISSSSLDISPGETGTLIRSQLQFSF
jgi:hypothetical protein